MTLRIFVIALSVLVLAAPLAAQKGSQTDALSGTWAGTLTMGGASKPQPVTFQLTFDGKGAVSGTFTGLAVPGEVKKGTFDAKSGVLKLELGMVDESTVRMVLDGVVEKGTVSGRISGQRSGEFMLSKEK